MHIHIDLYIKNSYLMSLMSNSKVIFNLDLLNNILSFTMRPDKSFSSPTSFIIKDALRLSNTAINPIVFVTPRIYAPRHVTFWKTRNSMPLGIYMFYKKQQRTKHILV